MPRVGDLHTSKTFNESLADLKEVFRKWGVNDYVLPTSRGAAQQGGEVTIEMAVGERWVTLRCGKFKWGRDAPDRNLRALVMALDAFRLADQRGIGDVFAKVAREVLALPAPKEEASAPRTETAHDMLGVSPRASPAVLLAAYRARVKETHPDTGGDHALFLKLQEAARELGIVDGQGHTII